MQNVHLFIWVINDPLNIFWEFNSKSGLKGVKIKKMAITAELRLILDLKIVLLYLLLNNYKAD